MSIKDLIAAAFNKDATSFESAFSSVMKEKVGAAIDARFLAREEFELDEAKDEDDDEEDDSNGDGSSDEDNEDDDKDVKEEVEAKSKWHAAAIKGSKDNGHWHHRYSGEIDRIAHHMKAGHSYLNAVKKAAADFKEEAQLDEISGAKLGTYMIKARKSEAELDKKRDDSYDKPNTPENKAERKAISRALNKRRWGQGKALDKLTGSSFGKVPATEK